MTSMRAPNKFRGSRSRIQAFSPWDSVCWTLVMGAQGYANE
jgi:hypothetical protein